MLDPVVADRSPSILGYLRALGEVVEPVMLNASRDVIVVTLSRDEVLVCSRKST